MAVNAMIADLQAAEKLVKDKERELERIRLSRKHSVETIKRTLGDLKKKSGGSRNTGARRRKRAPARLWLMRMTRSGRSR